MAQARDDWTFMEDPRVEEESGPDVVFKPEPVVDLSTPDLYLNRELTWLNFVHRVLHEADDERTPLLERLKFVAIVGSILDEFFMKRIGGLKQQLAAGVHELTVDGRTPSEQIDECHHATRALQQDHLRVWHAVRSGLDDEGVHLVNHEQLSAPDKAMLRAHYLENIFPLVTPQALDPAHPFPFVSNLSLNLLVALHYPKDTRSLLARVKVPNGDGIQRFVQLDGTMRFVALEEIMAANLDLLFPGMEIERAEFFRVTRNADVVQDEEKADDLLALIESELRERRFAPIVRLEVAEGMSLEHRARLADEFELDQTTDVFEVQGPLATRDLMDVAGLDLPALRDPDHRPVDTAKLSGQPDIFRAIRDQESILLSHPYESFSTSVERFLRDAAFDPKVRAIKMTLYRTSSRSRVVKYLIDAALNGKQVAVVVELKARFDEQANIRWASKLEQAGIHVTYGVIGLKTHCKVILVVREDADGLARYVHIGTGNYHQDTAKLYSDFGLLTCDPQFGEDATELFNYLTTGYKPKRNYKKLLPAPKHLKSALLEKIRREIAHQESGEAGEIIIKTNALEDVDITRGLYEASQAGVKVDLIVRDTCRLRPGVPGVSDNIRVVSIVGRFLEHARVFYFRNGGSDEFFIGSADCMKRNLQSRVEVLAPVEKKKLQGDLRFFLDSQLNDTRSAWDMQSDGSYVQRRSIDEATGSQQAMIDRAELRYTKANRLKKRRPRSATSTDFDD